MALGRAVVQDPRARDGGVPRRPSRNGDIAVKPARTVRAGEIIAVRQGVILRTVRVEAIPPSRMGAARVAEFCTDLTPPEEFLKAREMRVQQLLARDPGAGRPTKRDRRLHDRLFE